MLYTQSKWSALTSGEKAVNVVMMATTVSNTVLSVVKARKIRTLKDRVGYLEYSNVLWKRELDEEVAYANGMQSDLRDVEDQKEEAERENDRLRQLLIKAGINPETGGHFVADIKQLAKHVTNTTSNCPTCGPGAAETRRLPGETNTKWADRLVAEGLADLDKSTQWLVEEFGTKAKVETAEDYW